MMRVILVEDNAGDAELIREMLEGDRSRYVLKRTDRLGSALELLSKEHFDAVLLDLGLPDSTGLDTLALLQERHPALPIIILTGLSDQELATQSISRGAQDYLVKGQIGPELLCRSIVYAVERKRSERQIADSGERFRTLADNISQLVWMADREGGVFWYNKRWFDYTGTTFEEVEGWGWKKVHHPDHVARVENKIRRSFQEGTAWEDTFPLRGRDGEYCWFLSRAIPIRDGHGTVLRWLGTATDVTELRMTQEELTRSRSELEIRVRERTEELSGAYRELRTELDERERIEGERQQLEEQLRQSQKMEAIGTLAGGIAHDFNNMLAVIIGNAELIAEDVDGNEPAKRKVGQIIKASLRAKELIAQILMFSRRADREKNPLMLTPLLKETYSLLRGSLPSTIDMHLDLEAGTESDTIVADPSQIQQILLNLCANAAQAMREKGGRLGIRLSNIVFYPDAPLPDSDIGPGPYIELTVEDTGNGMTPDVLGRIFEPFFTTKQPGQGTGMGLAVVYGIVKGHGGAITVESVPGEGSVFHVYLPRSPTRVDSKEEEHAELPHGEERILFVDDEPLVTEMSSKMLKSLGYRVTEAHNGSEAWELFTVTPGQFDLVITDQTMPDITGTALAERMLKARKDLPILLCTGYSETVSAETAQAAGIKSFLMKPVTRKEMAEAVRRALDKREGGG